MWPILEEPRALSCRTRVLVWNRRLGKGRSGGTVSTCPVQDVDLGPQAMGEPPKVCDLTTPEQK